MKPILRCSSVIGVASVAMLWTARLQAVDLEPLEFIVPAITDARATVEVTWKAVNNGKTATDRSWYDRVYFSTDPELSSGDTTLGQTQYTQPVAAGATYTSGLKFNIPSVAPGKYYLILKLDEYNNLQEESEANNTLAKLIQIRVPDLATKTLKAPDIVDARQTIQIDWEVSNTGDAEALAPWWDRIYFSTDAQLSADDRTLGQTKWAENVPPTAGYASSVQCTIPAVAPGQYYLFLELDPYANVYEISEANNTLMRPIQVRVPDLVTKTLKAPDIVDARQTIQIDWEASNIGDAEALAPWWDRIYFSTDAQLSADDRTLGQTQWTTTIPAKAGYSSELQCTIPAVPPGQYYLFLELDPYANIYEISEANNTLMRPIQVRVPDLVTKTLKAPDIVDARETIQIDWEAGNSGDAVALAPWWDRIYLSKDEKLDSNDSVLSQIQWTNPVPAGSGYASSLKCNIPTVLPGNYFLILELDAYGNVFEVSEANNTLARPIQIRVPDLKAVSLKAPSYVDPGQKIKLACGADNVGDAVALSPWHDRIYLSADAQLDGKDVYLGQTQWTNPVPAGSNYVSSIDCAIPNVPLGQYYLIAELDTYGNVFEITETNNILARAITLGPKPVPFMTLMSGKNALPRELRLNPPTDAKRVELRLNGQMICTVYGLSMKSVDLADAFLEAGATLVAGKNVLSASAFGDDGTMMMGAEVDMSAWTEGMPTTTEILEPERGLEIYSSGGVSAPVDILLRVRAAKQRMALPGSGRTGLVESPMDRVLFYIDGDVVHTSTNGTPEDEFVHEYTYHSSGLYRGEHQFYARSDPPEGYRLSADSRHFYVTNAYPVLQVSRTVTQHSNWFAVTLQIRNTGSTWANLHSLEEVATGFQICSASASTPITDTNASFNFIEKHARTIFEFAGGPRLNSNDVYTVEYRAVPILFQTDTTYQFGGAGRLQFTDSGGTEHELAPLVVTDTAYRPGYVRARALRDAVTAAFRGSDYLLVTSPNGLETHFDVKSINVYTNMAELATLRNGVLGYFNGISRIKTAFRHGDFLCVGHVYQNRDTKDQIWIGRADDNTIRTFSETGEFSDIALDDIGTGCDLAAGDAMVVANFEERDPLPSGRSEIAIARAGAREFYIYYFDPDDGTWSREFRDPADFFETGDGLAFGEVIEGDEGSKDIILAKGNGEIRVWDFSPTQVPDIVFTSAFRTGDFLLTGYLLGLSHEQIVVGDKANNRVHVYVLNDSGTDFIERAYWSVTLDSGDGMAVGDVCGDGTDEIIVVDASADTAHVYGYTGTGYSFEEVATFSIDYEAADRIAAGFLGSRDKESILHVYGHSESGVAEGSIDIIRLGPGEVAGDRWTLDELLNEGGLWASQLSTNWTRNGFLLIVGEEGIVPTFRASWDLTGSDAGQVDYTDRNYASTGTDASYPELCMGRIPGDSAARLAQALRTAINVAEDPGLLQNRSAYCVSGANRGASGTSDSIDFTARRDSVAAILRGTPFSEVIEEHSPCNTNLLNTATNKDVLFLAGHGSHDSWDVLTGAFVESNFTPGGAPIVYACSCLTGRYPDGTSLAEAFLFTGASAYVGATAVTISSVGGVGWARRYGEEFFRRLEEGRPLGDTVRQTVRYRLGANSYLWDPAYNAYHCAVIQYFGDPKMEVAFSGAIVAGAEEPMLDPTPELALAVPMYIVRSAGVTDMVEIPGEEAEVLEPGQPILPAYAVHMRFPAGQKVQGVTLKSLSEPLSGPSLDLPIADLLIGGGGGATVTNSEPGWFPNMPFDWWTRENPDGSTTLRILAYAVQATNKTQIRFYSNYVFGISYTPSSVEIQQLSTDRAAYPTGAVVRADLHLRNSAQVAVDVTVQARVCSNRREGTNDIAVPIMRQVQGYAWTRFEWNTAGSPPGPYTLEVVVRDPQGLLLDEAVTDFVMGQANGEIAAFNLSPQDFAYGQDVQLSARFTNTGSTTLGGSVVIDIQDAAGTSMAQFGGDFTGVSPGGFFLYQTVWTNANLSPRNCRAVVYAEFGGQKTAQKTYSDWQNAPLIWEGTAGADGTMVFRWYSVAGRRYTVEFTPELAKPFASILVEQPANPPLNTFQHKPAPPAGFYRLREL